MLAGKKDPESKPVSENKIAIGSLDHLVDMEASEEDHTGKKK